MNIYTNTHKTHNIHTDTIQIQTNTYIHAKTCTKTQRNGHKHTHAPTHATISGAVASLSLCVIILTPNIQHDIELCSTWYSTYIMHFRISWLSIICVDIKKWMKQNTSPWFLMQHLWHSKKGISIEKKKKKKRCISSHKWQKIHATKKKK